MSSRYQQDRLPWLHLEKKMDKIYPFYTLSEAYVLKQEMNLT